MRRIGQVSVTIQPALINAGREPQILWLRTEVSVNGERFTCDEHRDPDELNSIYDILMDSVKQRLKQVIQEKINPDFAKR